MIMEPKNPNHHGFTSDLAANGSLSSFKFQVWSQWDWVYIGKNIHEIAKIVERYENERILPGGHVRFW